jgi:hypothetical protein
MAMSLKRERERERERERAKTVPSIEESGNNLLQIFFMTVFRVA